MSNPNVDPAHWSFASPTVPEASKTDANLRLATENVQPIRLRRTLQELRQTLPDPHKVTAALLLATQQKYMGKIIARKGAQSEEEEKDDEDEDDKDDSGSVRNSNVGGISERTSEEQEDEENSDDGSDDGMERLELGSEEEDDGTDEEGASTTMSTRHLNVKSELREKE